MKVEMVMPQMGESITEATVLKWLKGIGDSVRKDETILEISTDKVDSEIPAPETGVIVELKAAEGDTVSVKSVIAIIDTESASSGQAVKATNGTSAPSAPRSTEVKQASPTPTPEVPTHDGEKFYSPLVKSLSAEHGVSTAELSTITGSGARERVTKADLMAFIEKRGASAPAAPQPTSTLPAPAARPDFDAGGVRVEQMSNMRQKIAAHMVQSKATSAHVYSTTEVDVTAIAAWRKKKQSEMIAREGFKLSFTPFFLEAAIKALVQFPYVNSSIEGDKIILKKDINLGCAVALGSTGLIVPVIHKSEQLSLVGIARALTDIATRARSKQLKPEDVSGGTFTVTNPGVFGNLFGNPIINQPQVAILSIGAIKKRPMVINDMIAIRDMVYLTLSYDHRLIDGSLGGQFLQYITKYLEGWNPERSL